MGGDFDAWNILKKNIHLRSERIYYKQGDVWWASIGRNVGTESLGKGPEFRRPVLVIKKLSSYQCIVIPLSTQHKVGTWFCEITIHGHTRTALLGQIRTLSVKRFQRRLAQLDESDLEVVKRNLAGLLGL